MWEFIDSLSSMFRPRFLTTDYFIISEFPMVIKEILTLDNYCQVPVTRNSVFSSLRSSLSCSIHEQMLLMEVCMEVIASCWLDKSLGLRTNIFVNHLHNSDTCIFVIHVFFFFFFLVRCLYVCNFQLNMGSHVKLMLQIIFCQSLYVWDVCICGSTVLTAHPVQRLTGF